MNAYTKKIDLPCNNLLIMLTVALELDEFILGKNKFPKLIIYMQKKKQQQIFKYTQIFQTFPDSFAIVTKCLSIIIEMLIGDL